jgi:hypothetical protein
MSHKDEKDAAGRKQPSKYLRKKRATKAARHRWKHKYQLVPGLVLPWNERSLANTFRHLAACKRGGKTTGAQIKEQQRLFWRWYHGDCKAHLRGPFRAVVETLERIEAAYEQRYGQNGPKWLEWEGFMAEVFATYILSSCSRMKSRVIEQEMWERYETFMSAEGQALHKLLGPLYEYEDAKDDKKLRLDLYRSRVAREKREQVQE